MSLPLTSDGCFRPLPDIAVYLFFGLTACTRWARCRRSHLGIRARHSLDTIILVSQFWIALTTFFERPLWVESRRSLSDLFPTICSVPESFLVGLSLFYSRQLIQSEIHILPIG